ncbi:hypothetical protein M3J09_005637 [Ascochyta lentis]
MNPTDPRRLPFCLKEAAAVQYILKTLSIRKRRKSTPPPHIVPFRILSLHPTPNYQTDQPPPLRNQFFVENVHIYTTKYPAMHQMTKQPIIGFVV